MQLKLEVALLASFGEKNEVVNTMLGKGKCIGEDEAVKLFVKHCFQFNNWIEMVTWKWY